MFYFLFAKFLVDDDPPFVAENVSQVPVDTEVNSACVPHAITPGTRNFYFLIC